MIQVFVGAEIAVYEYDCTGRTRKPDALTSQYKAECDARERNDPPIGVSEPWEWSTPAEGLPKYRGSLPWSQHFLRMALAPHLDLTDRRELA